MYEKVKVAIRNIFTHRLKKTRKNFGLKGGNFS
jgi:hypothetical protein